LYKIFQPYQHANSNSKKDLFKSNLFLLLLFVHFFCVQVGFSQNDKLNLNGYNTFYFSNGKVSSEGFLEKGKPNGYWKTYYENGSIKTEGNRKDFKLDSIWKFYTDKGKIHNAITYQNDYKTGYCYWYDTLGNVKEMIQFSQNLKSGDGKTFYSTGEDHWIDTYELDKKEGASYEYDTSGTLITIRIYTNGFLRNEEQINRTDKFGNKQGIWKEFYEDGKIKWEGRYIDGQLDGIVKEYTQKGGLKLMEKFEMGVVDEKNDQVKFFELQKEIRSDGSILVGGYNDGKKQGVFREYDSVGNLKTSYTYKNDIKTGEGLLDTLGNKDGVWTYFYDSGELQVKGFYISGIRDKEWIFYYKNGAIQQKGIYSLGKPQGTWKWWYHNKQLLREETYRKGKEDGTVIEYDSLGVIITQGEFVDGLREGKWLYSMNDYTEEGEFRDNERHGIWLYKYKDGTIAFEGEYVNGLPVEKHKYYYPTGQLQWVGKYRNGLKDGEWTKFNEDGTQDLIIEYKLGLEIKIDGYKIKPAME